MTNGTNTHQGLTRRRFLGRLALAGGDGALYHMMHAMGLLQGDSGDQGYPLRLEGRGDGKRVIILGAGIAGLVSAYEMSRVGYECQLLEARTRTGGRLWTARRGTEETEVDGVRQVCEFDEGQYHNMGPARIPYHHRAILGYCRDLGVPMQLFANTNRSALVHNEDVGPLSNQNLVQRAAIFDLRGHTAELLTKAINQDALDDLLTVDDKARMVEFLRLYGDLAEDNFYRGSPRRGYAEPRGAGAQPGRLSDPYDLGPLLQHEFWQDVNHDWTHNQHLSIFQVVGGNDGIARALEAQVRPLIRFNTEVQAIRRTPDGVRVIYRDKASGQTGEFTGDYCICTIPPSVLTYIPADLPPGMQNAVRRVTMQTAVKIGLQFKRRFWEEDHGIYGGISWTDQTITQLWYPSSGYNGRKGVMQGAYAFGSEAYELAALNPAQRVERALTEGERIHPQYRQEYETAFSTAWHMVPYSLGCYAIYSKQSRETYYRELLNSDGVIYLAGDHVSYLGGWMEGAAQSAYIAIRAIHERARQQ